MKKRPYLIAISFAGTLALTYWCLENANTAQGLRQTLVVPAILGALLLRTVLQVSGDPGIFVQSLDTDVGGHGPMFLRAGVFALLALAVCIPWCLWFHNPSRRRLICASTILAAYLLATFGFMAVLGLGMRHMMR